MKHIFIVNPAAGKGKTLPAMLQRITYACKEHEVDYEIYHTVTVGDATRYVAKKCRDNPHTEFRFYACGGDGTMNEVANAVVGVENAQLAVVPKGTGNDFVRIFSSPENFNNIGKIICGKSMKMDIIKFNDKYSLNILNVGFDCDVVKKVEEIKRGALVLPGMAYPLGILKTLTSNYGMNIKITTDNGDVFEGEHLLALFANARYYGGGYKSAPYAYVNDGLMDVCVVEKIPRSKFIQIIPQYKNGTYYENPEKVPFVHYVKCKKVILESDKTIGICADGEVSPIKRAEIEIVSNAINVVVPQGCKCRAEFKGLNINQETTLEKV